jgi:hypothetical protein
MVAIQLLYYIVYFKINSMKPLMVHTHSKPEKILIFKTIFGKRAITGTQTTTIVCPV